MEFTSKGIVTSLGQELKTKSNESTYKVHTVKHSDGPIEGQVFFAQRTLSTKDADTGEVTAKEDVKVGQEVTLYSRVIDGKIFTEISTGVAVANEADLLSRIASFAGADTQNALSEQQM